MNRRIVVCGVEVACLLCRARVERIVPFLVVRAVTSFEVSEKLLNAMEYVFRSVVGHSLVESHNFVAIKEGKGNMAGTIRFKIRSSQGAYIT